MERVGLGLDVCCLMTPVSVRTFGVMYDHAFSKRANHQIRHQATYKVSCQPGHFILPQGFVWVCLG